MGDEKPGAAARVLLEEAQSHLEKYKAIHAEFDGKDMPEEKRTEADKHYEEFERFSEKAKARIADDTKAKKATEFEDYRKELNESRGRIPVGAQGAQKSSDDETPTVVYKAHGQTFGDKPKEYVPSRCITETWTQKSEAAYTDLFRHYIMRGEKGMSSEDFALYRQKALSVGTDTAGGFWVMSEVVASELISALEDLVFMRQIGTVRPPLTQATSISVLTDSGLDDAAWTTELATGSADTATPAGRRTLTPHPLAKRIKISNSYLMMGMVDGESYAREKMAEKFAAAEETAYMEGTGAGQPEGVFVSALPTDVTAASATDIAYADLVETEFSLHSTYRRGASWIIHRTILKEIHLLVDGVGLPIVRRDPAGGARFDLLGYPVNESEYAPSDSSTGLYVAALGDWKRAYHIQDTLNTRVKRLDELYAESDETGFIGRKETDGMIVDGNGVVRLVMA